MPTVYDLLREAYSNWDDAESLARTGRELHERNRLFDARNVLARVIELTPKASTETWDHYAFAHLRDFMGEEGVEILRRAVAETDSDSIRSTLSSFTDDEEEAKALDERTKVSEDPEARVGYLWKRINRGEAAEAIEGVRKIRKDHPGNAEIRTMYAWMLLQAANSGQVEGLDLKEEGLPLTEQAIAEEPDRITGYMLAIYMLQGLKDWEGVLAATERALERFPDDETVMHSRGQAYRELEDPDRAAQWFARAVGAKPTFAGARRDLGKIYESMGRPELAEEMFREIPKAYPDYKPGPVSLALFLGRQERWEEAEAVFLETWPVLPTWFKGALRNSPDAAALLEREAVKKVMDETEGEA